MSIKKISKKMLSIINDKTRYNGRKHYSLGCLLYNGVPDTVEKDHKLAYQQFASDPEDIYCIYNMACMTYNGQGVASDLEEAMKLFKQISQHPDCPIPTLFFIDMISQETTLVDPKIFQRYLVDEKFPQEYHYLCRYCLAVSYINVDELEKSLSVLMWILKNNKNEYHIHDWITYLIGEIISLRKDNTTNEHMSYFLTASEKGHQLAKWRVSSKDFPDKNWVKKVEIMNERKIPFWTRIYDDLYKCQEGIQLLLSSAVHYRQLGLTKNMELSLQKIIDIIDRDEMEKGLEWVISQVSLLTEFDYIPGKLRWCRAMLKNGTTSEQVKKCLSSLSSRGSWEAQYLMANFLLQKGMVSASRVLLQDILDVPETIEPKLIEDVKELLNYIDKTEEETEDFIKVEYSSESSEQKTFTQQQVDQMVREKLSDPELVSESIKNMDRQQKFEVISKTDMIGFIRDLQDQMMSKFIPNLDKFLD